jgi:uncharacterized protein YfdQ (DUF2303 family)
VNDIDNIQSALEAGKRLAEVGSRFTMIEHPNEPDVKVPVATLDQGEGGVRVAVLTDALAELDKRAAYPRRREGTFKLTELESFIAYINRYKDEHTTIAWADSERCQVTTVFDDHSGGGDTTNASWRAHRAVYSCPRSAEWQAWCEQDGRAMPQEKFGDFIEARLEDLRSADGYPKPLDVLAMARHLVVRSKGTFERQVNPTTGEGILVNKLENDTDSTVIPRAFVLGIPVFEGGDAYQVEARVRFAITEGRAAFSYTLHRRKEIERDAFADVRAKVVASTSVVLLAGSP